MVCTGNICRSPAVQHLLAQALDDTVTITSAGTNGMPGWPVDVRMAALLAAEGVDVSAFRSRPLTGQMVADADLILTVTAAHRAPALNLFPAAVRRTATLGELSRLAGEVPSGIVAGDTDAERLAALVPAALAQRYRFIGAGKDDDVPDPYLRSDDVYRLSYVHLRWHVQRLVAALRRDQAGGSQGG
jgi:protein-tyrosine phosphatase